MKMLKLAEGLELPLAEAVAQKYAWLGRSGSGKTYGCGKLVELFLEEGVQVVILDLVGPWAGLRTGRKPFSIPVFGGLWGDIALSPNAGALMADLIVDRNLSAVLDISQFDTDADQRRFATAFATRLFQRKKASPSAMHLVLEEAQELVPQDERNGMQHLLHAFNRLIKIGRNYGIGISLISQRPQEVNKKALNQTECMFAFQTNGPQEKAAIEKWVDTQGVEVDVKRMLPKLKIGCPYVWSPQWLEVNKIVRIFEKRTGDVSKTPKFGVAAKARELSKIDLKNLREQMAETAELIEADDPKALKRRIAELEAAAKKAPQPKIEKKEVPVLTAKDRHLIERVIKVLAEAPAHALVEKLGEVATRLRMAFSASSIPQAARPADAPRATKFERVARTVASTRLQREIGKLSAEKSTLSKGHLEILKAVAQHEGGCSRELVLLSTGLKRTSINTYVPQLKAAGHLEETAGQLHVTQQGMDALGDNYEPLPTGEALRAHHQAKLPPGEARMFEILCNVYPQSVSREDLAEQAGLTLSSVNTYAPKLKTRKLVTEDSSGISAKAELFG